MLQLLKNKVKQVVPLRVVDRVRREIGALLIDSGAFLMGELDRSIPPTRMIFVGHGDFRAIGFEFLRYFVEFGGLTPDEDVLDVGSGIGRMALPLANYLKRGSYRGFDTVESGVEWCRKNITAKHPNFQFDHADIYNKMYNPKGQYAASEYRFPYDDRSFDFVILTSVFTHLLPTDARHYISEISRVLRPGGRVLGTWFLLNDESRALIASGQTKRPIAHPFDAEGVQPGQVTVQNPQVPEGAVAYDEALVRSMFAGVGMDVVEPIRWGSWCGRREFVSYQDLLIAKRRAAG